MGDCLFPLLVLVAAAVSPISCFLYSSSSPFYASLMFCCSERLRAYDNSNNNSPYSLNEMSKSSLKCNPHNKPDSSPPLRANWISESVPRIIRQIRNLVPINHNNSQNRSDIHSSPQLYVSLLLLESLQSGATKTFTPFHSWNARHTININRRTLLSKKRSSIALGLELFRTRGQLFQCLAEIPLSGWDCGSLMRNRLITFYRIN